MLKHYFCILIVALFPILNDAALVPAIAGETAAGNVKVDLTEAERAFLAGKQIRLGVDDARPPFEFINEKGDYAGICAGFVEVLSARLGITMIPQEKLKWHDAMEKVKIGEVDVIPKVTPTKEREKFLIFTRPYATFPSVIVTRLDRSAKGLGDLPGLKVGVVKGLVVEAALKHDHPELSLVPSPNIETALRHLATGKIDAFVDNLGTVSYTIDKLGLTNLKIAGETPYSHDLAFGVRKDWPLAASALDKALATITDEERTAIKNQWLAIQYQPGVDWRTIGPIGAALLLVIAFVVVWNRRLGRAVRERKRAEQELQEKARQLELRSLVKSRVAEISVKLQQATTLEELSQKLMSHVAPLVGADHGVFYIFDEFKNHLRPVGGYAYMEDQTRHFAIGQGLVGQCALGKVPIIIADPQGTHIHITWGSGEAAPKAIMLHPVMQTGRVLGVIELAALKPFGEEEQALLEELLPVVAMNLEILDRNLSTQRSLDETLRQTKAFQSQQEQLRATEAWFRGIIESAPDGILVTDDRGVIVLTNLMTDRMFGYEPGELPGRNVDMLVPQDLRAGHRLWWEKFMRTGVSREMGHDSNLWGVRQDGSVFPVAIGLSKLPALGGKGLCVCVLIRHVK
ncbi:MAG: transporter substrate-binding domain-containing protein [Deltaproteobacteria bacterium]|nr:transporter substrate-binding domain-containing protein [Deltaproteobacteria bacterium]